VPIIKAARKIVAGGGIRAGLGELAITKARAWLAGGEKKDLDDFKFLLTKIGDHWELLLRDGEEMGDLEASRTMGKEVRGAHETLLKKMLGSAE